MLSSEYAARAGQPIELFGWQREIFDAYSDPAVETEVLMCGTQLVKTLLIQASTAYDICEDPGPILIVQPKDGDAKSFSKERLAPMLRDCPALRARVSEAKGRASSNTIQEKTFPGGTLAIVGAIAPGNLARRSIMRLKCDEVDKYPLSAGTEGDPVDLATERMVTFGARKKRLLCCSPTILGRSRIGKAYEQSDRRKPWVPCPACGQLQILKWGQVKFKPEAAYECAHCAARWNDAQRKAACEKTVWRAEAPFRGTAGFWISHLYSPWKTLESMVEQYHATKGDRERYRTFVNTTLAELWQEEGETPDEELLFARREKYPFGDKAVVPQRGLFLTAAVDVQDNPPRLEVEVVAWGRNRENWSVDYRVLQHLDSAGQPMAVTSAELWDKLNTEVLQREYRHESGNMLPIMLMAIDTGKRPKPVYEFALKHPQPAHGPAGTAVVAIRSVVPIKGSDDALRVISSVSNENAARKRQGIRIVGIGTHCVKQELYDLLRHVKPKIDGAAVPGCYHFPEYERSYFEGLCSEKRVIRQNGTDVAWEKVGGKRNEPLDLKVYNRGAAAIFGIDRMREDQWVAFEEALKPINLETPPAPAPVQQEQPDQSWVPKRNWFNNR